MASNAASEQSNDEQPGLKDQDTDNSHRFSEPWEDSDLILVVEDEKFHVHRLILSMNSPVFKAMFKSGFQEETNNEIPLPGKKANEVLDFLKQFYMQEREEITMENVEHLLKLSDEYQVKRIFDSCVNFLEKQAIEEGNVMKILMLANLYSLGNVRQSCYNLLKYMKLRSIKTFAQEQHLDKQNLQDVLEQRIVWLETFLVFYLYPQFIGMVECCFWLWHEAKRYMAWCPQHFSDGKSYTDIEKRLQECTVCKEMITTMINGTSPGFRGRRPYGNDKIYFDKSLPFVIEQLSKLRKG